MSAIIPAPSPSAAASIVSAAKPSAVVSIATVLVILALSAMTAETSKSAILGSLAAVQMVARIPTKTWLVLRLRRERGLARLSGLARAPKRVVSGRAWTPRLVK